MTAGSGRAPPPVDSSRGMGVGGGLVVVVGGGMETGSGKGEGLLLAQLFFG